MTETERDLRGVRDGAAGALLLAALVFGAGFALGAAAACCVCVVLWS